MGGYDENPEIFSNNILDYAKDGLLNFGGGCVALPFPHRCGREKGGWLPCSLDGDAAADSKLKACKAGERFVGWLASQC